MRRKIINLKFWRYLYVYLITERLIEKKRFEQAIRLIESYLEEKGIYVTETIYYTLGKAYFGINNYELAAESFLLSIEYNSKTDINKANTYFYLGLSQYELKQFEEALASFQKTINLKLTIKRNRDLVISLPNLFCYLGRCYIRINERQKAYLAFNEGLKYEPQNEALQRELTLLGL